MPIDNYVPLVSGHKPSGFGTSGSEGLNIRGASTAEGAQVICFPYEDQSGGSFRDNELFELRATGEKSDGADYVYIIAKISGMAVTAPLSGKAGDQVIQAILAGAENQKWLQFSPNGGNGLIFRTSDQVLSSMQAYLATTPASSPSSCGPKTMGTINSGSLASKPIKGGTEDFLSALRVDGGSVGAGFHDGRVSAAGYRCRISDSLSGQERHETGAERAAADS